MDKLDVREREVRDARDEVNKEKGVKMLQQRGRERERERKVVKFNQVNERMCERRRSSSELVWLVEPARWCMHNHLGRLKVRLLKIQLTLSLCV